MQKPLFSFSRYLPVLAACACVALVLGIIDLCSGKVLEARRSVLPPKTSWSYMELNAGKIATLEELESKREIDPGRLVLIVGQSSVREASDPQILTDHDPTGRRWAVLGSSGLEMRALESTQIPLAEGQLTGSTVVVGLHPWMLMDEETLPHSRVPLATLAKAVFAGRFRSAAGQLVETCTSLVRYRDELARLRKLDLFKLRLALLKWFDFPMRYSFAPQDPWTLAAADITHSDDETLQIFLRAAESFRLEHFQDFAPKADSLRRVITGLRERGFNVVVLWMPEHSLLRSLVPPQAEVLFNQVLAEVAGDVPVPVISLRSAIPDEDFNSFVHVDRKGRKTVSELLPGLLAQVEERGSSDALAEEFRRPGVLITAPLESQVVQQAAEASAEIEVKGATLSAFDTAQVRWELPSQELASDWLDAKKMDSHTFSTKIQLPRPGWYRLSVRVAGETGTPATAVLTRVGVGDVYVIGGRQRAANSAGKRNKAIPDVVAWRGGSWAIANDPQLLASGDGGSAWPAFGAAVNAESNVPIGLVCLARKGFRETDWLPRTALYAELRTTVSTAAPNGVRAILWDCQGQGDDRKPGDGSANLDWLKTVVLQLRRDAGCDAPCLIALDRAAGDVPSATPRIEPIVFGNDGPAGCFALSRPLPAPLRQKDGEQDHELSQAIGEAWAKAAVELPRSQDGKPEPGGP